MALRTQTWLLGEGSSAGRDSLEAVNILMVVAASVFIMDQVQFLGDLAGK